MKVVSNSSPLIFLSAIDMLDILKAEFGEILVPEAVYDEVTSNELKGSNEVFRREIQKGYSPGSLKG